MTKESILNRNESYQIILPELGARQKAVYNIIKSYGSLTSYDLVQKMVLVKDSINGRVCELEDMALIVGDGHRFNEKTKRKNTLWRITTPGERQLITQQKLEYLTQKAIDLSFDLAQVCSETSQDLIAQEIKRTDKKIKVLI